MWRKIVSRHPKRHFSSSSSSSSSSNGPDVTTLYSFLQPTVFALKREPIPFPKTSSYGKTLALTPEEAKSLETSLHESIIARDTDEAWKSFKKLTARSVLPSKSVTNSFIAYFSSLKEVHNLKRAFASAVYVVEKRPETLEFETITAILESFKSAEASGPAFALIKCMFKNRYFVPFSVWGTSLVEISRKGGNFPAYLRVFEETCRVSKEEKMSFMRPDLEACNAALEGCCRWIGSVRDAEKVLETMSILGIRPDESSFCHLAYLYASKGIREKINELECLMEGFGVSSVELYRSSLISGFVKSGDLESVSETVLDALRGSRGEYLNLGEEIYREIATGFIENGGLKALATLIIGAQKLEPSSDVVNGSVGYGLISACVNHKMSDKAHIVIDEMNAQQAFLGLGVYLPILKAYCKEHRTAEGTQLVVTIRNSGLELDSKTYDSLIEASMSSQDFRSALFLFRDMREARVPDLKASYLTVMTGLMENNRPELMAAFLDEVVDDPRVEIGTHDWNSIIHAFCKAGRLEDARRTFRRMTFLRFDPNEQTYLSMIGGYVSAQKYFNVLMLWNEVRRNSSTGVKLEPGLVDAFLFALVKGGYFDAVMQVVEKSREMKIFVDKWRYKHAFIETHKKLKVSKLRRRSLKKSEALIAFKNWAGLSV